MVEGSRRSRRVYLWRHGRTGWNVEDRFQGHLDPALDQEGREQATRAAERLALAEPEVLVTSDLRRARQTAAVLETASGRRARLDPRLREVSAGKWEGLSRDEVSEQFPAEYSSWLTGLDIARGGGETMAEVGSRAAACVLETVGDLSATGVAVLVTHGGAIRATIGTLLDLPLEQWRSLSPVDNGNWSCLEEAPRGWTLQQHNADTLLGEVLGDDVI